VVLARLGRWRAKSRYQLAKIAPQPGTANGYICCSPIEGFMKRVVGGRPLVRPAGVAELMVNISGLWPPCADGELAVVACGSGAAKRRPNADYPGLKGNDGRRFRGGRSGVAGSSAPQQTPHDRGQALSFAILAAPSGCSHLDRRGRATPPGRRGDSNLGAGSLSRAVLQLGGRQTDGHRARCGAHLDVLPAIGGVGALRSTPRTSTRAASSARH